MTCKCVRCETCHGAGTCWFGLDGEFIGDRDSDMGDLDTCPDCDGTGITEICDECREYFDEHPDEW